MVLFGIFYKSLSRNSIPAISLTIYLVMGWTIVFFLPLFVRQASTALLVLIAAGGVLYTLGAWFYARQGFRYHHMVWHLLINLAVVAHFIGIVFSSTDGIRIAVRFGLSRELRKYSVHLVYPGLPGAAADTVSGCRVSACKRRRYGLRAGRTVPVPHR